MSQKPGAKLSNNGIDFTLTIHNETYDFISPEQFDLDGRAVLVTGASKGIGRATALSYARAGTSYIAIAARSGMEALATEMTEAATKAGKKTPKVLPLSIDVTSKESVQEAAKEIEQAFGRLDVLINNAGYMEKLAPIIEQDADDWWKVWEVNIRGPYLVTQALLPLILKTQGSLKIILNVASIGAHQMLPGGSGYQTGKLALLRIGEHWNLDYKDQGLLSFGIHPGGVMTSLASGLPQDMHGLLMDTPELAGDSIVWLTSERREWLAGRYVSCTWDFNELLQKREKIEKEDLLKVRMDVGMD